MIRTVIFLVDYPFNQRDFDRFGVEMLLGNGFDVQVWDLTDILRPHLSESYQPPDPIDWAGCTVFNNKKVALEKIRNLPSDTFIINLIEYSPKTYRVYRAISASRAAYAVFMAGAIPSSKEKTGIILSFLKKLSRIMNKKAVSKIVNYINSIIKQGFYRLPYTWMGIKPASIILAGGEECLVYPYPVNKNTEILWAHTFDYDLYLKERNTPSLEQPIAVFLDEYVPFHSDYVYMGIQAPTTADRYYPVLNRFFSLVERELGLKVIIAAHPRSRYEDHPDYFEGRKWVRGKTIQLIKESRLVLAHSSTSVNFANLFHKPIVFLTSADLDKSFAGSYIWTMADWFGHKPVFMDSDIHIDWARELMVDEGLYQRYRRAYIKTEHSEDIPFWQIVANRLKGMA